MKIVALKLNKEFKRLYYKGRFKGHALLVTYLMKNNRGINRVGITTGKKVGNAVQRSRAAWAEVSSSVPAGYDLVFVAREKTPKVKSQEVARVMKYQLQALLNSGGKRKSSEKKQEKQ